jgi:hypothetical protein
MREDPLIGLRSRMAVIEEAIAKSPSPSMELIYLVKYYREQILKLERKPWKA